MKLFDSRDVKQTVSREDALSAIPVRNKEVRELAVKGGVVQLVYNTAPKPWFGRLASRVGLWDGSPVTKRLELDELGTMVWEWIDGERSVEDLATLFAEEYGVHRREAELSVSEFLRMLGQRGIVGLL